MFSLKRTVVYPHKIKKGVGGIGNNEKKFFLYLYITKMKYQIDKQRLNDLILEYISDEYVPDYGWGDQNYYKEGIQNFGEVEFYINDYISFVYKDRFMGHEKILLIRGEIANRLTLMFSNLWVPVFKKWVMDNTGIKINVVASTHYGGSGQGITLNKLG